VISLVVTNCRWILVVIRVARPHLRRGLFREFFTGLISGKQFAWIMWWPRPLTLFHSPRFLIVSAPISMAILVRIATPLTAAIPTTTTTGATRFCRASLFCPSGARAWVMCPLAAFRYISSN
jgi:hypothetical protein